MKNAVSTALRTLGLTVSERDSKSTTSKYLGIRFQDGTILQVRVANHTGKRSITKDEIRRHFNDASEWDMGSGRSLYSSLSKRFNSKLKASEHLLKHGIKGITYIRRYNNGIIHAVVVSPFGELLGQDIRKAGLITQYPVEKIGEIYNSTVEWINPKMTKASNAKSEASHINDLSHKGTVPSPKTNSPNLKGSTISDSRHLSMSESSENDTESQAHFSLGEEELSEKEKAKLYKQKRARELITSVAGKR